MKQYYNNGPEGMPRVERMSDSTLDWVINGVNTDGMLVAGERAHQQLRDVCHAVAEETLARISWPERAGLPAAPARIELGTFTVERDDSLPAGVAELRDDQGKVLGRISNITTPMGWVRQCWIDGPDVPGRIYGADDPEVSWGAECPPGAGWMPMFPHPVGQAVVDQEACKDSRK